jgi:murein DD-endopeptidase MepM/ murein hydrolase activator NlpD
LPRSTRTGLVAATAAALAAVLLGTSAAADPDDDRARVERELEQTRAAMEASSERVESAAASLLDAKARLPEVQQRLADARGQLAGATVRAKSAARAAEQASADLAAADVRLGDAEAQVEGIRTEIESFAANAYMGRGVAGIDAMLSLESPGDFVASLSYLRYVGDTQQEMLDHHTQARGEARNVQNVQMGAERTADEARRVADDALRQAAAVEAEAARAEQEVASLVAQREQALQVAEEERAATLQRYAELQAESERIAAEIRALAAGGGAVLQPDARLLMPVIGRKTSDFGNRFDPVYKVWQLHAGVDIAAAGGSSIRAAAAGNVFRAGWNGGYGNYTCIYHGTQEGKGVATCYAHQSAILVSLNQQVAMGDVIGRVGTTGASTGNHLHFEVRLDGTPVDPLNWLPACLC